MLRVTVELIPYGIGEPEVIGTVLIGNDGTSQDPARGNYIARSFRRGKKLDRWTDKGIVRETTVQNYARLSLPVWTLVAKVLAGMKY